MMRKCTKRWNRQRARAAFLSCALLCTGTAFSLAQVSQPGDKQVGLENDRPPALLEKVGIAQRLDAQLPLSLSFVDDAGKQVQLGQYFGKHPAILALVY